MCDHIYMFTWIMKPVHYRGILYSFLHIIYIIIYIHIQIYIYKYIHIYIYVITKYYLRYSITQCCTLCWTIHVVSIGSSMRPDPNGACWSLLRSKLRDFGKHHRNGRKLRHPGCGWMIIPVGGFKPSEKYESIGMNIPYTKK